MKQAAILIPAYKPEDRFTDIVRELMASGFTDVIVVDDGGGEQFRHIFEEVAAMGAVVLTHVVNLGKGRALKTGLNYYCANYSDTPGVITMDCDGQHKVTDVVRVAQKFAQEPDKYVLGVRKFVGNVPFRSRFGNGCTCLVYHLVSGKKISDTQTGLRAIPRNQVPHMLKLPGERYEFEMMVLMELKNLHLDVAEVEIETVYENNNKGSHFNTISDSWLVYKVILGFVGSSVVSFMLDYVAYAFLLMWLTMLPDSTRLLTAEIIARAISSAVNFCMNRKVLLTPSSEHTSVRVQLVKYYILVAVALAADYGLIMLFQTLGISPYIGKLISGVILYVINFFVQKRFVFK